VSVAALLASLLPEIVSADPRLIDLTWKLDANLAIASVDDLGDVRRVGGALHVTLPPDILSIVEYLHRQGWKRDSHNMTVPGWELFAFTRGTMPDGTQIQVTIIGYHHGVRPDGVTNIAIPFFAPEPPPIGVGRGWKERYLAWDHKCKQSEW
jgi:hypothetical protein